MFLPWMKPLFSFIISIEIICASLSTIIILEIILNLKFSITIGLNCCKRISLWPLSWICYSIYILQLWFSFIYPICTLPNTSLFQALIKLTFNNWSFLFRMYIGFQQCLHFKLKKLCFYNHYEGSTFS